MIHGVINLYKEKGYTSHDAVAKLRGILHQKKIGHTGTLDPDAEGVLPVCMGAATKLCDMLTDTEKEYRARMLLGQTTDTQDTTGRILAQSAQLPPIQRIQEAIDSFIGGYDQIPPMYSALKVNGRKLYELAREGKTVERKARRVQIQSIIAEEFSLPYVTMTVVCSKGTYIRTLCSDIGEKLGCGGCMAQLWRTRVGNFNIQDSLKIADVEKLFADGKLEEKVVPAEAMLLAYPALHTKADADRLLFNGNPLFRECILEERLPEGRVRMHDSAGRFLAVYEYEKTRCFYRVVKTFFT